MKNKKVKILISLFTIIILTYIGYSIFFKSEESSVIIKTIMVKNNNISNVVTATGTIEPIKQVEVGTQVSGEVEKMYVDFNSIVKKGQLIAELDKTNLKASLVEAQANYNRAISERNYLLGVFNRQKTLFDNKLISLSEFEEAQYNLENTKATVTQRSSDLNKAKTNLGYADIYSPIDGVVLSRDVDQGQTVAANFSAPTLFTIAQDLKEMQVEAAVDEADIGSVNKEQRVTFTVDAFPNEEFLGQVTQVRLNPTTTSNVVTYTVVIKAENPNKKLMPGLTATITIFTLEVHNVLTVEAKAINFSPNFEVLKQYNEQNNISITSPSLLSNDGKKSSFPEGDKNGEEEEIMVWVKTDNSIKPKPIKVGISDGINVQILEGLKLGEEVVYSLSVEKANTTEPTQGDSPFMPKPPGKRK